jgi:hypothetical protein
MAGFRLTDGSEGCPPTEAPPSSYQIPFRFDSAGRLWITSCFKGFRYFGAARHDLPIAGELGGAFVPNSGTPGASGAPVVGGTYENITVTNDTECDLGILLGLDVSADLETRADNLVIWTLASRWNGETHSICSTSTTKITGSTSLVRQLIGASANPHDLGFEDGAGAVLTLAPGASAVIGAKLYCYYGAGAPTGTETVYSSTSAVRVYGYILP